MQNVISELGIAVHVKCCLYNIHIIIKVYKKYSELINILKNTEGILINIEFTRYLKLFWLMNCSQTKKNSSNIRLLFSIK